MEVKMAVHVIEHRLKAAVARENWGLKPVCMHVMAKLNPCFFFLAGRRKPEAVVRYYL